MKKIFKTLAICAVAGTMCAGAVALAGCGETEVTGEAYGLVHGGGFVGYASITYKGDDVTALTLTEVCFPTQVKASASVAAEDKVVVTEATAEKAEVSYYKTVSYGDVTLTYDAEKGYMSGTNTFAQLMATEANCKAYYEAVVANEVSVTIGSEKKTDIMNYNTLSKEKNGYWSGSNYPLGWKGNRDATVAYVLEHGVDNLLGLVKSQTAAADGLKYWMDGDVSTGATWNDFNTVKEGTTSYAQLIVNAYDNAK